MHLCFKEQYKNKTNIVISQERHLRPIKAVELWPLYSSTNLNTRHVVFEQVAKNWTILQIN